MSAYQTTVLLDTPLASLHAVCCAGHCRQRGAEEVPVHTNLVYTWRGAFVRHVGRDEVVAQAQDLLFFNAGEPYRVSHPLAGGDACLVLHYADEVLFQAGLPAPPRRDSAPARFAHRRQPLSPRLRLALHGLGRRATDLSTEPLAAEAALLALLPEWIATPSPRSASAAGAARVVDRVKLLLLDDPARRWSLRELGVAVQRSPVYLTQAFQQIEGVPLYRYQVRLRLNEALLRLPQTKDLSALALDLGFTSHSHFSASFRACYGVTPSAWTRGLSRPARVQAAA